MRGTVAKRLRRATRTEAEYRQAKNARKGRTTVLNTVAARVARRARTAEKRRLWTPPAPRVLGPGD